MPTYPFWCNDCENYREDIRRMADVSDPAMCDKCGKPMDRVYTAPQINIAVPPEGYYNHGLGKYISRKSDITEAQRQYKDEHGTELVEIGNERIRPKTKPPVALPNEVVQHMASDEATVNSTKTMLDKVKV